MVCEVWVLRYFAGGGCCEGRTALEKGRGCPLIYHLDLFLYCGRRSTYSEWRIHLIHAHNTLLGSLGVFTLILLGYGTSSSPFPSGKGPASNWGWTGKNEDLESFYSRTDHLRT